MTTHKFAVVDELFSGYTIIYSLDDGATDVFCDRCEEWVYDEQETEDMSVLDLYEDIVDTHAGETITFK